jgi:hypothetical protein
MISVTLAWDGAEPVSGVRIRATLSIKVAFRSMRPISPVLGVVIKNSHGVQVFGVNNGSSAVICSKSVSARVLQPAR